MRKSRSISQLKRGSANSKTFPMRPFRRGSATFWITEPAYLRGAYTRPIWLPYIGGWRLILPTYIAYMQILYTYACRQVCIYYTYTCIHACMYVCMHVRLYLYIHICTCVCVHTYIKMMDAQLASYKRLCKSKHKLSTYLAHQKSMSKSSHCRKDKLPWRNFLLCTPEVQPWLSSSSLSYQRNTPKPGEGPHWT